MLDCLNPDDCFVKDLMINLFENENLRKYCGYLNAIQLIIIYPIKVYFC